MGVGEGSELLKTERLSTPSSDIKINGVQDQSSAGEACEMHNLHEHLEPQVHKHRADEGHF